MRILVCEDIKDLNKLIVKTIEKTVMLRTAPSTEKRGLILLWAFAAAASIFLYHKKAGIFVRK